MKTLRLSIFVLATLLACFACEEDCEDNVVSCPDPDDTIYINPSTYLHFDATFTGENPTTDPMIVPDCNAASRVGFYGTGNSPEMGGFTILKNYCFQDKRIPGRLGMDGLPADSYITRGDFTLTSNETPDAIFGKFYGEIHANYGGSALHEEFTITGGSGKYKNASGNLTVRATGDDGFTGKISGNIWMKPEP